mgnify:CR=1 FL=1
MKKSGSGHVGASCPYCGDFLEFEEQEVHGPDIVEVWKCPGCGRKFEVVYKPVEWREI